MLVILLRIQNDIDPIPTKNPDNNLRLQAIYTLLADLTDVKISRVCSMPNRTTHGQIVHPCFVLTISVGSF